MNYTSRNVIPTGARAGLQHESDPAPWSIRRVTCTAVVAGVCVLGMSWLACKSYSSPSSNPTVDRDEVSELSNQLRDSRDTVRRRAIIKLAQLGPEANGAAAEVERCLGDSDPYVRAHAARAAIRLGRSPAAAVDVLTEILAHNGRYLKCLAALILGEIGSGAEEALPALHNALRDADNSVRLHAAEASLRIDAYDASAMQELLAAMDSDDPSIRRFAVDLLGNVGQENSHAQLALHWALTDSDPKVAISASLNLARQNDQEEIIAGAPPKFSPQEIARLVEQLRDETPTVRQTAAIKLGMSGSEGRKSCEDLRQAANDHDLIVRVHALHALWRIEQQPREVVPALIEMLGSVGQPVRIAAASILGEIGPDAAESLPNLTAQLGRGRLPEQLHLACIISRIDEKNPETAVVLATGLRHESSEVRYQAVLALACSSFEAQCDAESELVAAAADSSLRVASIAAETLGDLRDQQQEESLAEDGEMDDARPVAERLASLQPEDAKPEDQRSDDGQSAPSAETPADKPASKEKPFDPHTGIKSIREVHAAIRISPPDPKEMPDEEHAKKFLAPPSYGKDKLTAGGKEYHIPGYRRGFVPVGFGWDSPAVCFRPLYFQDINLERYGINYGCFEIARSTLLFTKNVILFPYHLIVQPGCENIYTLGYDRPNNCMPMYCYHMPCPDLNICRWFERQHYRPYRANNVWDRPDGLCDDDCDDTFVERYFDK
jgi:HEAT repeat protein